MPAQINCPSKNYVERLPIAVQQAFRSIKDKEYWTADSDEKLSIIFESLVSMSDFQAILTHNIAENEEKGIDFTIQMLAYLRIEQAILFLKMMPDSYAAALINDVAAITDEDISDPRLEVHVEDHIAERLNMLSRLDTLARLNMLSKIFSPERCRFIASVLQKA